MDYSLLLEYSWVLLVLIALEGILAADNAMVLAIMVKHLPDKERKRALFYGLAGAFVFRFGALFAISLLINVWQIQALGAIYLLFISLNYLFRKYVQTKYKRDNKPLNHQGQTLEGHPRKKNGSGFWMTVLKVEIADIAFAVDSILAAVALAMTLPDSSLPQIGGIDGGKYLVIFFGGLIGVIIMRFAAVYFVKLLHQRPGLETAAFIIVGWVGVKLVILTLAHPEIGFIGADFSHSYTFKTLFYAVIIIVVICGWFFSNQKGKNSSAEQEQSTME